MAILSPFPKIRAFDANGNPLVGGKLNTYEPGTLTPKATFTTAEGTTANANPVILDARGEADVWLEGAYRWILTDANDVQQWDVDQINAQVGLTQVFANATIRTLTAAISTPQLLQEDAIPALSIAPDRVLNFEYFGQHDAQTGNNTTWRLKYDNTVLYAHQEEFQNPRGWRFQGTLLMRDSGSAEVYGQLDIALENTAKIQQTTASVDLSQAFTLGFEMERDALTVSAALHGSAIQIAG